MPVSSPPAQAFARGWLEDLGDVPAGPLLRGPCIRARDLSCPEAAGRHRPSSRADEQRKGRSPAGAHAEPTFRARVPAYPRGVKTLLLGLGLSFVCVAPERTERTERTEPTVPAIPGRALLETIVLGESAAFSAEACSGVSISAGRLAAYGADGQETVYGHALGELARLAPPGAPVWHRHGELIARGVACLDWRGPDLD